MNILTFKDGHDPAACVFVDGKIMAAAEEERFIRSKHAPCVFPQEAIRFCLKKTGLKEQDIDFVVYARLKPFATFWKVFLYYLANWPSNKTEWNYFYTHMLTQIRGVAECLLGRSNYQKIHKFFPSLPSKIYSFEHHLCHAASAYYYSGFKDALIVTMDGKGEATSVMVSEAKGERIKVLERKGIFESLGLFYSSLTKFLGFTPNDGEYKVMGLAPYGKPEIIFDDILAEDIERGYKLNSRFVLYPYSLKNFEEKFGAPRGREGEVSVFHKNLAASSESALERAALSLVKKYIALGKSKNLCLAGGVALNVKMNKFLWESDLLENIFIQPAAGDAGLVLGAAALMYAQKTGKLADPLSHMYFGPEFMGQEIEEVLKEQKIKYETSSDVASVAADLLSEGKVLGWFEGRMEFGPRALGCRSVLAHPGKEEMKELVNEKIKFREAFRPFCPSGLSEEMPKYFKNYTDSPYMIMSFSVRDEQVARLIPAVIHVDGTARPQAVKKETNPLFYSLIEKFYKKTGLPFVLNTSMNIRGEPIVCSPKDAVEFFMKSNIDALIIGNFIAKREWQDESFLSTLSVDSLKTEY